MERSTILSRKDRLSFIRRPFIRRIADMLFRQQADTKAIYQVELNDTALWEMSAHDALRMPLTESAHKKNVPLQTSVKGSLTFTPPPSTSSNPECTTSSNPKYTNSLSQPCHEQDLQPIQDIELDEEHYLPPYERQPVTTPIITPTRESTPDRSTQQHSKAKPRPKHKALQTQPSLGNKNFKRQAVVKTAKVTGSRALTGKPQGQMIKKAQPKKAPAVSNDISDTNLRQNKESVTQDNIEESPFIPQLAHPAPMTSSVEKAGALLTHLVKKLPDIAPEQAVTPKTSHPEATPEVTKVPAITSLPPQIRKINKAVRSVNRSSGQNDVKQQQSLQSDLDVVLLIEPNEKVRQALAAMVKNLGVRCMAVTTAQEGLNFMHRIRPSVVLVEQNIPDMATTEFIICIRRLYRNRPVPVVLMGEEDNQLYSEWTLRLSVEAHLAKPFNSHGLAQVIGPYASLKTPLTNTPYVGAVGLVIEEVELRNYLRRILVRHGYSITMSCDPARLKYAGEFLNKQHLDAWLVQAEDEELCADVVDCLESSFSSPVYVGFDDLDLNDCSDGDKLRWKRRLLQKLGKLVESKTVKVA